MPPFRTFPPKLARAKPALEGGTRSSGVPLRAPRPAEGRRGRTLRVPPPSGLGLLASRHGTSGMLGQKLDRNVQTLGRMGEP